ncbi:MAG: SUMF1/EgtB/PvdO family nonheme iron enzyme [Deltaproteobacteria bacterium]|nr:SUMF1/EgtB/PvdO family nonheme iron enzyme [Deltaproteobacteria bacterium]
MPKGSLDHDVRFRIEGAAPVDPSRLRSDETVVAGPVRVAAESLLGDAPALVWARDPGDALILSFPAPPSAPADGKVRYALVSAAGGEPLPVFGAGFGATFDLPLLAIPGAIEVAVVESTEYQETKAAPKLPMPLPAAPGTAGPWPTLAFTVMMGKGASPETAERARTWLDASAEWLSATGVRPPWLVRSAGKYGAVVQKWKYPGEYVPAATPLDLLGVPGAAMPAFALTGTIYLNTSGLPVANEDGGTVDSFPDSTPAHELLHAVVRGHGILTCGCKDAADGWEGPACDCQSLDTWAEAGIEEGLCMAVGHVVARGGAAASTPLRSEGRFLPLDWTLGTGNDEILDSDTAELRNRKYGAGEFLLWLARRYAGGSWSFLPSLLDRIAAAGASYASLDAFVRSALPQAGGLGAAHAEFFFQRAYERVDLVTIGGQPVVASVLRGSDPPAAPALRDDWQYGLNEAMFSPGAVAKLAPAAGGPPVTATDYVLPPLSGWAVAIHGDPAASDMTIGVATGDGGPAGGGLDQGITVRAYQGSDVVEVTTAEARFSEIGLAPGGETVLLIHNARIDGAGPVTYAVTVQVAAQAGAAPDSAGGPDAAEPPPDAAEACVPSCGGKECGDDGCGGSCPPGCDGDSECAFGTCRPKCTVPCGACEGCSSGTCAPDGTKDGKPCGPGLACTAGACVTKAGCPGQKDCAGRECGLDPVCGAPCGLCQPGLQCTVEGKCGAAGCAPDCPEMVPVAAGPFWMGCEPKYDPYGTGTCGPYHEEDIAPFHIDRTEVTVEAYQRCVEALGCKPVPPPWPECNRGRPDRAQHPVDCLWVTEAREYCTWAGKRLCSEAQWEKAARGTDGRVYPWGAPSPLCDILNCGTEIEPVGSRPKDVSPYGVLDMGGSLAEWVRDRWRTSYGSADVVGDGSANLDCCYNANVYRGVRYWHVFSRDRANYDDKWRVLWIGFRCCRSDDTPICPDDYDCRGRECGVDPVCGRSCAEVAGSSDACGDMPCGDDGRCVGEVGCGAECGTMVEVPAGPFWMGCATCEAGKPDEDATPYHEVTVPAFEIDKYEVTIAEYELCERAGPCTHGSASIWHYWGVEEHPAGVARSEAAEYCAWVGKRLCSEAEWEKAARGTDGRIYPWGDEFPTCDLAVMTNQGTSGEGCSVGVPFAVGSRPAGASPYGAMDMTGNRMEWVADAYHGYYTGYDGAPTDGSAWGEGDDVMGVARGGPNHLPYAWEIGTAYTRTRIDGKGSGFYGFRCCR